MPEHGNLAIALRREPIELNDAAFADEWFVTVPRIVTAFECQQRSGDRRHFNDDVTEIMGRAQQSKAATSLVPALVHID